MVRNYYEQLYAKKFESVVETDKFLELYNLPKWNQSSLKTEKNNNW